MNKDWIDLINKLDQNGFYSEADSLEKYIITSASKKPRWETILPAIGMAGVAGYGAMNPIDNQEIENQTPQAVSTPVAPSGNGEFTTTHPVKPLKLKIKHKHPTHPAQKANFKQTLDFLSGVEGGYTNRPITSDPGGATNKGITHKEYDLWRKKHHLRRQPVTKITEQEKNNIVKEDYWKPMRAQYLPKFTSLELTNYYFNGGPAVKNLQHLVGAPITGRMGPITVKKVWEFTHKTDEGDRKLAKLLADAQIRYQRSLKKLHKKNPGWENRYKAVVGLINPKDGVQ